MAGIILISDGNGTTIENGNIETGDINSDSLTTNNINTSLLTCNGEFRCNINGPLTIPTSISSLTGLLISYGNTSNSGATDFTNFGSTYTTTQQGFRFFNKSNTQTLTNLAIIDNSQTYFSSQLTGVTCETPVGGTSVVNKTFTDNTYINFTTDQTISASNKRFNGLFCTGLSITPTLGGAGNRQQIYVTGTETAFVALFNNNFYRFYTRDGASTQTNPLTINSASTTITNSLITNNLTADNITGTQDIFTTNTTGIINIGTGLTTGTLNIGTATSTTAVKSSLNISKGIVLYDVVTPFSNFCQLYPSGTGMNYIMNAGATTATSHNFFVYNNTNNQRKSLGISYTNIDVFDGVILSCRQIYSTAPSSVSHELFTGMTTGTLTMGSLTQHLPILETFQLFNKTQQL
jgi:hypothetical protein